MKVIIAGSRTATDSNYKDLLLAIDHSKYDIQEVVSGCAIGADRLGEKYATSKNLKTTFMPADWQKYGKSAGHKRNRQMALYADAAIVLWDGVSVGSKNMIYNMNQLNKPCYIKLIGNENTSLDSSFV